ncbi:hypothetical protein N780_16585 [Pontibacillus chungwhensis BH030062]|uniref:Peptidase M14 domain-containing protein n=1 Tax=Pontibacillus chungwhensis BH030062 TaxID=1385513 RepID=A0A0A2UYW2_9BACI|nr:M14 family metallocarboxypeptidase [Pontibacillus chungwhensis]KGP91953.1 hypothetical protein N780_16585 [Pontibacillus chungwhensis BH030062]
MVQFPYDSKVLEADIKQVVDYSPEVTCSTIGQSVLGKPLYELKIGEGPNVIHWNGSFHANEWMTTALLMSVMKAYVEAIEKDQYFGSKKARDLYTNTTLSLVPMVNPDGVDLFMHGLDAAPANHNSLMKMNGVNKTFASWKANIRGVDLNNQFPANWEVEKARKPQAPSFRDFPGERPLTEPEAIAMAELTKRCNFNRVLAFHSQGEVIYWGYQGLEPEHSYHVVEAFYKESGYEPVRTIDSYAGFKDWFIQDYKKEGYTIEVGKGINPLPLSTFPYHYERVKEICALSLSTPLS